MAPARAAPALITLALAAGCNLPSRFVGAGDGAVGESGTDASADGGRDAAADEAGTDAATDAARTDAGTDAGPEAGTDAGTDAAPACAPGLVLFADGFEMPAGGGLGGPGDPEWTFGVAAGDAEARASGPGDGPGTEGTRFAVLRPTGTAAGTSDYRLSTLSVDLSGCAGAPSVVLELDHCIFDLESTQGESIVIEMSGDGGASWTAAAALPFVDDRNLVVGAQTAGDWVADETIVVPPALRTAGFRVSFHVTAALADDVVGLDDVRVVVP